MRVGFSVHADGGQRRARGTGTIFKPKGSRFYWIAYVSGGKRRFEGTQSERKKDAQDLLTQRLGDTQKGIVVTPKVGRITLGEGLTALVNDLTMNGRKAIAHTQRRIDLHIVFSAATPDEPAHGHFNRDRRLNTITTFDLTAYASARLEQGAAAASVNQELAILRRAFRLALRGGEIATMPYIPMLKLDNARKGVLERDQFEAILTHLPAYLHAPLTFMFVTGWRLSEVFSLTVAQVDLTNNVVRLEPGSTKNKEGRTVYVTGDLRTILQQQLDAIDVLKTRSIITPFVFHYPDGRRIKNFRSAWENARKAAGYPKALLHDFRRSAVRSLERAGVPRSVAMARVGHRTESIYKRYAIVDEQMHKEAAERLDAWATDQRAKAAAEAARKGQVKQFSAKR